MINAMMLSPELKSLYEQQTSALNGAVRTYTLNTHFGSVAVMEAGLPDAPPLLALHGMHTPAPFNLELLWPLTQHFRVVSPDFPAQAGKTVGIDPSAQAGGYALWVDELMDALNISQCPMVGLSFGGAVLLDVAAYKPQRISAASLIVPAGFFRPILRPIKKLVLPLMSFTVNANQTNFDNLMKPVMADNWPALEAYYFAAFNTGIPMLVMPPGPYNQQQLANFHAPVQLFIAEEDVYFSPNKLERKARQVIQNLESVTRVNDCHIPNLANRSMIQAEVVDFMQNKM